MQSTELKNLKVAVIGAGYGGAATAKALSLLGADVTAYEQASRVREVGAGIGLRPTTMDRFRQWGIFDAVADVSSASDYFEILTATCEPIMQQAWPGIDDFEIQTRTHLIHRGDPGQSGPEHRHPGVSADRSRAGVDAGRDDRALQRPAWAEASGHRVLPADAVAALR